MSVSEMKSSPPRERTVIGVPCTSIVFLVPLVIPRTPLPVSSVDLRFESRHPVDEPRPEPHRLYQSDGRDRAGSSSYRDGSVRHQVLVDVIRFDEG